MSVRTEDKIEVWAEDGGGGQMMPSQVLSRVPKGHCPFRGGVVLERPFCRWENGLRADRALARAGARL